MPSFKACSIGLGLKNLGLLPGLIYSLALTSFKVPSSSINTFLWLSSTLLRSVLIFLIVPPSNLIVFDQSRWIAYSYLDWKRSSLPAMSTIINVNAGSAWLFIFGFSTVYVFNFSRESCSCTVGIVSIHVAWNMIEMLAAGCIELHWYLNAFIFRGITKEGSDVPVLMLNITIYLAPPRCRHTAKIKFLGFIKSACCCFQWLHFSYTLSQCVPGSFKNVKQPSWICMFAVRDSHHSGNKFSVLWICSKYYRIG